MPNGGSVMYKDKFVLTIMREGSPLREFGPSHEKKVAMPFGSEYKIRLKNKYRDRSCAARIFVDGSPLSTMGDGDIIIGAGATIDLERFITDSLHHGRRLKFVSLKDPNVSDPFSKDNGLVRVEFRLAKEPSYIMIRPAPWKPDNRWPDPDFEPWAYFEHGDGPNHRYKSSKTAGETLYASNFVGDISTGGATVEGGYSGQSFTTTNLDIEQHPTAILSLRIVGIGAPKTVMQRNSYCTKCGAVLHSGDRFCGKCGKRI